MNDFILGGGGRRIGASSAIPHTDYFESGRIISRFHGIRARMQNMHADTAIHNGYASLPLCMQAI
ncbi:hypothetical protein [Burkholderia metallica]|uniref:hypothetical protein n=1 Tax=Burkholderia metallica TaxID=488729 RepID=UPI0012F51A0C|nr:hypothetical protein [Burkholderia metallica]